jgi:hypothetical protein
VAVAGILALLGFALLGWGLCGATIGVARQLMPMETALVVHAVAAPIIAGTLVQMGCDRAGWYSWDRLDNGGRPSADRILPELQGTAVGDTLPNRPGHREGFEVLDLAAPRCLVLGAYFRYLDLTNLKARAERPSPADS